MPETAVRFLREVPAAPYAKLRTITIQDNAAAPAAAHAREVRQAAAQIGANGVVIVSEKTFRARNVDSGRSMELKRTVYLLIYYSTQR